MKSKPSDVTASGRGIAGEFPARNKPCILQREVDRGQKEPAEPDTETDPRIDRRHSLSLSVKCRIEIRTKHKTECAYRCEPNQIKRQSAFGNRCEICQGLIIG